MSRREFRIISFIYRKDPDKLTRMLCLQEREDKRTQIAGQAFRTAIEFSWLRELEKEK